MCNWGTYQNQSIRGKVWVYITYNLLRDRLAIEKESDVDRVQVQERQQDAVIKVRKQDLVTVKKEVSKVDRCHYRRDFQKLVSYQKLKSHT